MPTNVIMPALELAQEKGKVLRWLKAPGDRVAKGDPIVDIETDKVTVAPPMRHVSHPTPPDRHRHLENGTEQPHSNWRTCGQ